MREPSSLPPVSDFDLEAAHTLVAEAFHTFGEEAAHQLAERLGVTFEACAAAIERLRYQPH